MDVRIQLKTGGPLVRLEFCRRRLMATSDVTKAVQMAQLNALGSSFGVPSIVAQKWDEKKGQAELIWLVGSLSSASGTCSMILLAEQI